MNNRTLTLLAVGGAAALLLSRSRKPKPPPPSVDIDWGAITSIYYDPAQDDPQNHFLAEAASIIKTELDAVMGGSLTIDTSQQPSGGIILSVDPNAGSIYGLGDEAYSIYSQLHTIWVTAASSMAARHGAYGLLHHLGYRWYFPHPTWWVRPAALPVSGISLVQHPRYQKREVRIAIGNHLAWSGGTGNMNTWIRANRMTWPEEMYCFHSWPSFASKASVAAQDPTAVCYKADGVTPQQVIANHPVVIDRANNYARSYLADPYSSYYLTGELLRKGTVPISPPDGNLIWCDEYLNPNDPGDYDPQMVTDMVFGLSNEVARTLQSEFPGILVSTYSYSWYGMVPTIALEPNLWVEVTTFTRGSATPSFTNRLRGFKAKGVNVGAYDYFDVWPWWRDRIPPAGKYDVFFNQLGIFRREYLNGFIVEGSDNWGPKGRLYWVCSQVAWQDAAPAQVLEDFYPHAFGPAAQKMRDYYTRFDTMPQTQTTWNLAFIDLRDALTLTSGQPAIQERIRHVLYHAYFWYKWGAIVSANYATGSFLDLQQGLDMWSFIYRIKTLQIIVGGLQTNSLRPALLSLGATDVILNTLTDSTVPTPAEAQAWLQSALDDFGPTPPADIPLVDISAIPLVPLADALSAKLATSSCGQRMVLEAFTGETVNVELQATNNALGGTLGGTVTVYDEYGVAVDQSPFFSYNDSHPNPVLWAFSPPSSGRYWLVLSGENMRANLPGRGISFDITESLRLGSSSINTYFWVPQGTPALGLIGSVGAHIGNITLTSPSGAQVLTLASDGTQSPLEGSVESPEPGLWRFVSSSWHTASNNYLGVNWYLLGTPPLLWHDPEWLLVPP